GCESGLDGFLDLEVFKERKIHIPGAWSNNESSRTWIEEIGANGGIADRPISQLLGKLIISIGAQPPDKSLRRIHGNQVLQVSSRNIGSLGRIKIPSEPEPLPSPKDVH